jgi:hypothetical protein
MKRWKTLGVVALAALLGIGGAGAAMSYQQDRAGGREAARPDMGAMLVEGLRATPGCLGADAGRMASGKSIIVAWFENKAAVIRWYESDVHQRVMRAFAGVEDAEQRPLQHVTDEDTPIMVVASLTFENRPRAEGVSLPISQISIELYAPLPGGAYVNGRLAPDAFVVPHMRNFAGGYPARQPESE